LAAPSADGPSRPSQPATAIECYATCRSHITASHSKHSESQIQAVFNEPLLHRAAQRTVGPAEEHRDCAEGRPFNSLAGARPFFEQRIISIPALKVKLMPEKKVG
jgi:hypothetical protein